MSVRQCDFGANLALRLVSKLALAPPPYRINMSNAVEGLSTRNAWPIDHFNTLLATIVSSREDLCGSSTRAIASAIACRVDRIFYPVQEHHWRAVFYDGILYAAPILDVDMVQTFNALGSLYCKSFLSEKELAKKLTFGDVLDDKTNAQCRAARRQRQ